MTDWARGEPSDTFGNGARLICRAIVDDDDFGASTGSSLSVGMGCGT